MCLAVPSEIIALNGLNARIDVSGARRDVSLMLLPEPAAVGEFVIVHAGFALQKIDREAGLEAHRLLRELVDSEEFRAEYGE